jgi:RimJ/RimL family protein N-acetyltransferase
MLGPILRGEIITLEPPKIEDIDTFRAWLADLEVTRTLLVRFVPSRDAEEKWYERVAASDSTVIWSIVVDGKPIGNTGIDNIDWINRHATTGTVIGEKSAWGKGYASEAVKLRTAYAFGELGLERLETECLAENVPMHRALEKSGYQRIGRRRRHVYKGGNWHDTILFELLRHEWLAAQG